MIEIIEILHEHQFKFEFVHDTCVTCNWINKGFPATGSMDISLTFNFFDETFSHDHDVTCT